MLSEDSLKNINRKLKLFLSLGFAAFLGLLETFPFLIESRVSRLNNLWLNTLIWFSIVCGFWVITVNFIWFLENKFSFVRDKIAKDLLIHVAAVFLLSAINAFQSTALSFILIPATGERYSVSTFFLARLLNSVPLIILIYSAILGVGVGLSYYRKYQERTLRASQLEAQLAQAQLQTLKTQLQPHFLFNTLNGIVGLIRNNKNQAAIDIVTELSELLRYVIENAGKETVELKEEIEFTKLYLDLHQKRFSNRLSVEMNIAPETLPLKIPNLILQPLVENAIVHGIAKSLASQTISIETRIVNRRLIVNVKNDGTRLPENQLIEKGLGLTNTYSRLEKIYDHDFDFEIKNQTNNGVIVNMNLPLIVSNSVQQ
jgi:two-component system, LytTR family, sensor kinase